ncbi:Rnf electron transport complex subunit RnfB [Methanosalsum natronophilum]|uniref:Ion-translocating oxidoreductase complex subunit B n=1 Tax=Methanosalsum natronophilum TaxID=768733 RepID=A0A3R7X7M6_9EURY|nr:Rnf electron transport complex subunit RnfB [Methanosalsum natronophilum]MCS3923094.1 electron transport complex protein RnfB [Methanosalsum natronophilum]RQD90113.1 MAG: Fe-S cluster domain-containing protein [Methanosalsum natronophilum]
MNTTTILIQAIAALGGLAMVIGIVLVMASKVFKVETNPLVDEVLDVLPGANCGACGYAGCGEFAEQVVEDNAPITGCPLGGFEVEEKIGGILGKEVGGEEEPEYPIVHCKGGTNCTDRFNYIGVEDCKAVMLLSEGEKECNYGCMGRGTCVRACPFGAIIIDENKLPKINNNLCTSCGLCVASCPNDLITLSAISEKVHVLCNSHDKGKFVKSVCSTGCIGCKLCAKVCPEDAIKVTKFLAEIDPEKCTACGDCIEKCPQNTIEFRD